MIWRGSIMNKKTLIAIPLFSVLTAFLFAVGPAAARGVGAGLGIAAATSTTTIPLQVRLASSSGSPVNGLKTVTFKLYTVPSSGLALWSETWTASNAVQVTDGVASVLLGSQTTLPQSLIATNSTLYLGITVDVEAEMQPRVQLGSTAIAMTVPDGTLKPRKLSALTYSISSNTAASISQSDTWYDLPPLSVTIPAADVPVATEALVLFNARCRPTAGSGMAVQMAMVVDSIDYGYTNAMPGTGQFANFAMHNVVTLGADSSHTIKIIWGFALAAGAAECSDRRLSVILLGQ